MAMLFPWATKEYLLWEMTIGQIILYHNQGLELKYGKEAVESAGKKAPGFDSLSVDELKRLREESKRYFEAEGKSAVEAPDTEAV